MTSLEVPIPSSFSAMAQSTCFRSIYTTITSAMSSFALFAASNWGLPVVLGHLQYPKNKSMLHRVVFHVQLAFLAPLVAVYISIANAIHVWTVQKTLSHVEHPPEPHSIPVITLCPILLRFPETNSPPQEHNVRAPLATVTDQELMSICPLELQPQDAGQPVEAPGGWKCVKLPETSALSSSSDKPAVLGRALLLSLPLVPGRRELSFLPSRNAFQATLTMAQAIAYILGVIERLIQHLGVSPLEAIVTFHSIIVTIQLAIDLFFANGTYQRCLLIRLNTEQYRSFRDGWEAICNGNAINGGRVQELKDTYVTQLRRCQFSIFIAMVLLSGVLVTVPSLYYAVHYFKIHRKACAMAGVLFLVAQFVVIIVLAGSSGCGPNPVEIFSFPLVFLSILLHACSLVIAIIYTAVDWTQFHTDTHLKKDWFSWIVRFVPRIT